MRVRQALEASLKQDWAGAFGPIREMHQQAYSTADIVSTCGRVAKTMDAPENIKLEWLKEVGLAHMRVNAGAGGWCSSMPWCRSSASWRKRDDQWPLPCARCGNIQEENCEAQP